MIKTFNFKNLKNKFLLLKNNQVLKLSNFNEIKFESKHFAEKVVNRLNSIDNQYLNDEIIFFICFSENLNNNDKENIIEEIIYQLNFDEICYRTMDSKTNKLLDRKLNKYILEFENFFEINFVISTKKLFYQKNLNTKKFRKFLQTLNNDILTVFFKLCKYECSPILSYFFVIGSINEEKLYNLSNLEIINNFRNKKISEELKVLINERKKNLKNISKFFNLLT